ncbi:MAG: Xaa-Pro peptidase family protein [Alphaproteobacteria bacterium]|jgi:Xaa-Pro dipeptidase|nr:Xaa-Pro dipeptidase [Rhodospirillaceae bacterium]MDP6021611.1 Xaa-Pro peptidase family protein [Alphaproteobacteria bacterium]MDP6255547.1 Xaa-Pro peptidase family protein [Alphaproteobacteria bacterium]MDP7056285.1 Xaa-Pro peptidase family protein [Alphaproteobacteria bacterium]MDP7228321.1 Xaa-Pro peptidase family protein [Alphaproteobacteria bacterium]|tara:strand:+ start:2890 stop:4050 length:1161 start_codon:yes stop_codon:yes gene_type:complete
MTLHFEAAEFEQRISNARRILAERGLAAILIFAQESHYYLSGYDTTGYVFFQCLVLTADQQPLTLLTRRPDLEQARRTSIIEDIRIWYDREDASPTDELREILAEKGLAGARMGVELDSYGLRAHDYERLKTTLNGWCELEDASSLVRGLRLIKSETELAYVRRAAELADASLLAMLETAGPGAFEGDIAAAGTGAILSGGGEPAPSGPVLGSGDRALLIRSATGFRHLDAQDQLTMEFAGSYRHYCACLMRTVAIGSGSEKHRQMSRVTKDALSAMTEAARPGYPLGKIDDAHRRIYDENSYGDLRMAACGYSLGASFRPTWMDVPPMLYSGNPLLAEPGMVLFLHAILIDSPANLAMSLGHTIIITDSGAEVLSRLKPDYIICT